MLSALDSSFVSCCSIVQFYELLLVLSFRHVTSTGARKLIVRNDADDDNASPDW